MSETGRARLLLALCAGSMSCTQQLAADFYGFLNPDETRVEVVERDGRPFLRVEADVSLRASTRGTVDIDSAMVVTRVDGVARLYDAPEVLAPDFPFDATEPLEPMTVTLEIPSPIGFATTFDAYCRANGRTADVTVSLVATDGAATDSPSVVANTVTIPLVPDGPAPAPNVFASTGPMLVPIESGGATETTLARGLDGSVLVTTCGAANGCQLLLADDDSVAEQLELLTRFEGSPHLVDSPQGWVAGGRLLNATSISVARIDDPERGLTVLPPGSLAPDVFEMSALGSFDGKTYAFVRSSDGLALPGAALEGPPGKAYGAFLLELDEALSLASASVLDHDVFALDPSVGGGAILVSAELPPRPATAPVRIERIAPTGEIAWVHEEPSEDLSPDPKASVRATADGGAIVGFSSSREGESLVTIVRLSPTGAVEFRYMAQGSNPSVAVTSTETTLVSFTGIAPNRAALPARAVPLLIELDGAGEVLRAEQLACGGSALLIDTFGVDRGGAALVVGRFDERATVGERTIDLRSPTLLFAAVD